MLASKDVKRAVTTLRAEITKLLANNNRNQFDFNASEFFHLSYRLANTFPTLWESAVVMAYHTSNPPQHLTRNESADADKLQRGTVLGSSWLAAFVKRLMLIFGIILFYFVTINLRLQKMVLTIAQPLILAGLCWFYYTSAGWPIIFPVLLLVLIMYSQCRPHLDESPSEGSSTIGVDSSGQQVEIEMDGQNSTGNDKSQYRNDGIPYQSGYSNDRIMEVVARQQDSIERHPSPFIVEHDDSQEEQPKDKEEEEVKREEEEEALLAGIEATVCPDPASLLPSYLPRPSASHEEAENEPTVTVTYCGDGDGEESAQDMVFSDCSKDIVSYAYVNYTAQRESDNEGEGSHGGDGWSRPGTATVTHSNYYSEEKSVDKSGCLCDAVENIVEEAVVKRSEKALRTPQKETSVRQEEEVASPFITSDSEYMRMRMLQGVSLSPVGMNRTSLRQTTTQEKGWRLQFD
jgi:hypothetical protein